MAISQTYNGFCSSNPMNTIWSDDLYDDDDEFLTEWCEFYCLSFVCIECLVYNTDGVHIVAS